MNQNVQTLGIGSRNRSTMPALRLHWLAVVAVLLGGSVGCGKITGVEPIGDVTDSAVDVSVPALAVWPADATLETLTKAAAARIEAATGLHVAVGNLPDAIPVMWTDAGEEDGWNGYWFVNGRAEWLAIDRAAPPELHEQVTLHEALHALGAAHIEERGGGVLSDKSWVRPEGWPLTVADLEAVCSARDCPWFEPEAP